MGIFLKVHQAVHLDNSQVIVKIAGVKVRMILNIQNIHLNIWVELTVIVYIPLPQPNPELLWPVLVNAVGGCKKMAAIYQSSSTGVHIVILVLL